MEKIIILILIFLLNSCVPSQKFFKMGCDVGDIDDCEQISDITKAITPGLNSHYPQLENKILELDKLCYKKNNHYACRAVSAYYINNNNYFKAVKYLEKVCSMNKVQLIDACDKASQIYKYELKDNNKYIQLQQKILDLKNHKK